MQPRDSLALPWLPVLLYHRVLPLPPAHDPYGNCLSTTSFAAQIRWLARRGYRPMPLSALEPNSPPIRRGPPPARPVIITFDDGYRDNLQYAWPILRRYGFTATIFLVSDTIGDYNRFDAALGGTPVPMLSLSEIRSLAHQGVTFGSHSCSHPASLVPLPNEGLRHEMEHSRQTIEAAVDAPCRYFAYPHSQVDARVERFAALAGYSLACAGTGTRWAPYRIHRVEPSRLGGAAVEVRMHWRRLKRLAHRALPR